jgi:xanthine dehydrogenase iron-sulfur cluster and FAD-binding subunit A
LALEAKGKEVTTAEGIASKGQLSRLQSLFVEKAAMQCGFCTPSFVLTAHYLLKRNPNPTEREIREFLSGHICRCGTYKQKIEAIFEYTKEQRQEEEIAVPPPPWKTRKKKNEQSNKCETIDPLSGQRQLFGKSQKSLRREVRVSSRECPHTLSQA